VISAGHCFGGVSRVWFGLDASMAVNTVTEVRHPGFNNNSLTNDLMMVQLAADAPVSPAPLLRESMDNTPTYIGPDYTWVGYGDDETGSSGIRRVVPFPVDVVGPATVGGTADTIDATMVYFQVSGVNTCVGDSGGPGFLIRNGVERHALVTSYGDAGCAFDGVGARTDMPQITGFIQAHIDQFEGSDPCRNDGVCQESCNSGGVVMDPDCHENHCGADGMCASACVLPVDPDCMTGVDYCGADGVCDPGCTTADPDCAALDDAGPIPDADPLAPDAMPAGDDGGAATLDATASGDGGAPNGADAGQSDGEDSGCGCSGSAPASGGWLLILIISLAVRRRSWP
jgi:MYXO-CTERM domain-containing protein